MDCQQLLAFPKLAAPKTPPDNDEVFVLKPFQEAFYILISGVNVIKQALSNQLLLPLKYFPCETTLIVKITLSLA